MYKNILNDTIGKIIVYISYGQWYNNKKQKTKLSVFNIEMPKDWYILLIQALEFLDHASNRRVVCIRQNGDRKSLPIQYCAAIRRYISIVVVPLISIDANQASNIFYASNSDANIYAEHLGSIREAEDVSMMIK